MRACVVAWLSGCCCCGTSLRRSDKWTDRQEVVKRLTAQLASNAFARSLKADPRTAELVMRVVCGVVLFCLVAQSCYPVYFSAFELWWVYVSSDLCVRIAKEPEEDEGGDPARVRQILNVERSLFFCARCWGSGRPQALAPRSCPPHTHAIHTYMHAPHAYVCAISAAVADRRGRRDFVPQASSIVNNSIPCTALVNSVAAALVAKAADRNTRTAREALKCTLALARNNRVAGLDVVVHHVFDAGTRTPARLELLLALVKEFKLRKGSALTLTSVMGATLPALAISGVWW